MLSSLYRASIWHPDSIPPDEWKYRSLKRVWLPAYDLVAIGAGMWAAMFGSPILHRLFPTEVIDLMGWLLAVSAFVCLAGVAFPRLWKVEILGKVVLVALLAAYAATVALFRTNPDPSAGFVCFIIVLALPLPMFRLTLLGEEIKERRSV
jgi:O-antigen ligase